MAIEYDLRIRDAVLDDRIRDLIQAAEPTLEIDEEEEAENENLAFALLNDLESIAGFYSDRDFRVPGRPRIHTNAHVWFRHNKERTPEAAMETLRIVLHLLDQMDNDMSLIFISDAVILSRVGGELFLSTQADFWDIRERKHMLHGRDYRMAPLGY